jgi:hypothetical protein
MDIYRAGSIIGGIVKMYQSTYGVYIGDYVVHVCTHQHTRLGDAGSRRTVEHRLSQVDVLVNVRQLMSSLRLMHEAIKSGAGAQLRQLLVAYVNFNHSIPHHDAKTPT